MKTEHDDRMNKLALRIGHVCDGEHGFDVACACALLATFSIFQSLDDSESRHVALEKVVTFMRERIAAMEATRR